MKIGILSLRPSLYSTRRIKEAAEALGHEVRIVDYLRCIMNITAHNPHVMFGGEKLDFDAIIPRIGASRTFYGTAVVRQFEMMGVYSANESQAINRSRDKLRSLQLLSREGVNLPVTGFAHSTKDINGLIDIAGGAPLVIKLIEGTQGIGVVLAETKKAAESVISAFRGLKAHILVQKYIKESSGTDIRAFVVGDQVVAAMKRTAPEGEFRSNIHRGGTAQKVVLTEDEINIALKATKTLGLNVAGVDIMRSNNGPLILEVNSSPGLKGIETCTGVDVATSIIKFLEAHAARGKTQDKVKG